MDVRYSKSGDMTVQGKNGLNIKTNASPKMGQDLASGGVSVLCCLAAPVARCFMETSRNFVIKSKSLIRSS